MFRKRVVRKPSDTGSDKSARISESLVRGGPILFQASGVLGLVGRYSHGRIGKLLECPVFR